MGQVALAWVLANPAISSCIVGAKSEEQLETSVATSQLSLSKSDLEEIDRLVPSGGPVPHLKAVNFQLVNTTVLPSSQ